MSSDDLTFERRTLLAAAAGLMLPQLALATETPAPARRAPRGRAGELDFLAGSWQIQHRQLQQSGKWEEFPGEATCWTVLGGVGSIEELRIPTRNFSGIGIRLLDLENALWNDFWVNGRSGVLGAAGPTGGFENGVGTFTAEETDGGKAIVARGVWDQITPTSCRWHQAVSRDGGKSWEPNWFMSWTRTGAPR
jgi:hypothetical protein